MIDYYRENLQMYIILIVWLVAGMYGGPVIYALVPLTMYLLWRKGFYEELFLGYLFVLVLSDSLETRLFFAKNLKNIYISMMAIILLFDRENFKPLNLLYRIFIPFFLISVVTMLFSIEDSFFFTSVQKTLSYFLSFLIIPNFVSKLYRDEGSAFLKRFVYFIFTILFFGILLRYIAPGSALLLGERFRGVFGGPNGLGVFCVLSFITVFVLNDFFPTLFSKFERRALFAIIILCILLCGSRNAVISILIFYTFQRFFSVSPFFGFIVFLITLFVAELISSNATSIVISLGLGDYFRTKTIEEGSGRYIAWGFAWKQIQQNFFIGKGFAYNEAYMRHHYGQLLKLNHQGGIHNSFLTFWMDQGLVGLLIYLRSYILTFAKAAKNTKYAFPIMFAISFSAFFESWLVGSLSPFAFMGMFIFTIISSEEIVLNRSKIESEQESQLEESLHLANS